MPNLQDQPPDPTCRKLIQDLLRRTQAKEVNWKQSGYRATAYEVLFPRSRVVLTLHSPAADPDYFTLELQNSEGLTVGAWEIVDPVTPHETAGTDWRNANQLFVEARRTVLGWDSVLKDVEAALKQPGSIGLSRQVARAQEAGDEDIPF